MVIHPDSIGVKGITILGWHVSIIFIDGRVGVGVGCCCCCCCVFVCWCCRGVVSGSVSVCGSSFVSGSGDGSGGVCVVGIGVD